MCVASAEHRNMRCSPFPGYDRAHNKREPAVSNSTIIYAVRLLIALVIGGLIGLERELQGKAAGIRTNMLMCIGSCLIMIISIEVAGVAGGITDPGRIAAQVVTGVGFLGAGTIIRSRFHITGLTTAATIWVLSALGLAIGAGYITLSIAAAVLITITLTLVRFVEAYINKKRSSHTVQIELNKKEGSVAAVLELFTNMNIVSEALDVSHSGENWTATFEYTVPVEKHHTLIEKLSGMNGVRGVKEL
jgi:putative Mg2+ transporter-C (MgtC) family protein